jgi:hypothetical protein
LEEAVCHFITLVAATSDQPTLEAAMRAHGRCATPVDNPSLARVLRDGERQYLTTASHCDCGTVFARGVEQSPEELAEEHRRSEAKLAKKGWSKAKIDRSLHDRERADARPSHGVDSLELWCAVLTDLIQKQSVRSAGLFVHDYRGTIASEVYEAIRHDFSLDQGLREHLAGLKEDQLLMVHSK